MSAEIEKHNEDFWATFKKSPQFADTKIICFILGSADAKAYVFRTAYLTSSQVAKILKTVYETMQGNLN